MSYSSLIIGHISLDRNIDHLDNEAKIPGGAVISGIILLFMRASMNTKNPQHNATNYETSGSYHLSQHQDLFLYSNISKRPKPQNNNSGSSTHRSSSGRTHGGHGGKF